MISDRRVAFLPCSGAPLAGNWTFFAVVDEVLSPQSLSDLARLDWFVVMATGAGTARSFVGGQAVAHTRESMLLIAPGLPLRHEVGTRPWRSRYLCCAGPLADAAAEVVRRRGVHAVMTDPAPAAWMAALEGIIDAGLGQGAEWPWRVTAGFTAIIEGFSRAPVFDDPAVDPIARLDRLIAAEPERAWTLKQLARRLGMSRSALYDRWPRERGALMGWITGRRLDHGRMLLAQGLAVGRVAEMLGYASPFGFSRAYRQRHGVPPSAHQRAWPEGFGGVLGRGVGQVRRV
jgi:AraC-like DNA-binding protein